MNAHLPKEQSDAVVAELFAVLDRARTPESRKAAAGRHREIYLSARWAAHNANRLAVVARREGSASDARKHQERSRWLLALARRHRTSAEELS